MIERKVTTNYLMDWNNPEDRINYFKNLRKFLEEVYEGSCEPDDQGGFNVRNTFDRWNVYFIDIDEIPRVNLDEPR